MYLPTEISNPETGERIVFDEDASNDERLVWDEWRPADSEPPPTHYHPTTEERFAVREGTLMVKIDGADNRLDDGEDISIPPQTSCVSYTEEDSARFRRNVSPPGKWREFLTERFAYAHTSANSRTWGNSSRQHSGFGPIPTYSFSSDRRGPSKRSCFRYLPGSSGSPAGQPTIRTHGTHRIEGRLRTEYRPKSTLTSRADLETGCDTEFGFKIC